MHLINTEGGQSFECVGQTLVIKVLAGQKLYQKNNLARQNDTISWGA
jgi:hypothetical protein